jgi:hypothetical protein
MFISAIFPEPELKRNLKKAKPQMDTDKRRWEKEKGKGRGSHI